MKWYRGYCNGLPLAGQGINALLSFEFLSAHYTEVAVAILLKMIFRVFSFSLILNAFSSHLTSLLSNDVLQHTCSATLTTRRYVGIGAHGNGHGVG